LVILALLLCGAGLTAWWVHYRPKWELARYQRQLIASGEKLAIAELIPPPTPAEQNSAHLLMKAIPLINTLSALNTNAPVAMRFVAFGKASVTWQQSEIYDYEGKFTNTWAEIEAEVAAISEGLKLLHQITDRPTLDFEPQYSVGFTLPLPNLAQTKVAVQRLGAAALCELHRGDTETATKNVRAMLAIVKGTTRDRLIISQLVRYAMAAITVGPTWELLQSSHVNESQLAQLQRDWEEVEFMVALDDSLAMERAMGGNLVARMRNSSSTFQQMASGFGGLLGAGAGSSGGSSNLVDQAEEFAKSAWDKTRLKAREMAWRVAWSYPDQLRLLKGEQVLLETVRMVHTNGYFSEALHLQNGRFGELGLKDLERDDYFGGANEIDLRTMLSQVVVSLELTIQRLMKIEAERRLCVTAIALKRYQLRHGDYPADLLALVPEFLPKPPRDPVDGKPLRYRRDGQKSFRLYSIGEDEKDDGGDPRPAEEKSQRRGIQFGRDWVWPQRATAEEIEANYDSLRKKQAR
jgi:hypothetical protein